MKSKSWLGRVAGGALLSPGAVRARCARGAIALVLPPILLALIGASAVSLSAPSHDIITVCPAGPPQCDYGAIQPALDVAAPGDTVLVKPGVYSGLLTLKSQVILESSDGPAVTVITSASSR